MVLEWDAINFSIAAISTTFTGPAGLCVSFSAKSHCARPRSCGSLNNCSGIRISGTNLANLKDSNKVMPLEAEALACSLEPRYCKHCSLYQGDQSGTCICSHEKYCSNVWSRLMAVRGELIPNESLSTAPHSSGSVSNCSCKSALPTAPG